MPLLDLEPIEEQLDLEPLDKTSIVKSRLSPKDRFMIAKEAAKALSRIPSETREEIINKLSEEAYTTKTPVLTALKGAAVTAGLESLPLTPTEMAVQAGALVGIPPAIKSLTKVFPVLGRKVSSFLPKSIKGGLPPTPEIKTVEPLAKIIETKPIEPLNLEPIKPEQYFEGVKEKPSITEPVLQRPALRGVSDKFKEFFKENPKDFDVSLEAPRLNKQMAKLIREDKVQIESIPILKDVYGLNNSDKELASQFLEEAATFGGQTLNFLSQVKKAIPKQLLEEIPEVPKTAWEAFAMRAANGLSKTNDAVRKMTNLWRASLVSQLKTSVRNAAVFGGRFSLKVLDDAAIGTEELLTSKISAKEAYAPLFEDILAITRKLTPSGRNRLSNILENEPFFKARLYGTPSADVSLGSKYANFLNIFNRTQEFFTRDIAFDATLTGELKRLGVSALEQLTEKEQAKILKKSVDTALDLTLSKSPEGKLGKTFVKLLNDYPILQIVGYPFPRFLTNSVRAIYEFSPFGLTRFLKPEFVRQISSGDKRAALSVINKAAMGSTMFAGAAYLRESKYAGEKWYEIKPDPDNKPNTVIDMRPFNPVLPTYMFIAEAIKDPSKMENRDWIEGVLGINRIAGTTLFMTSMLSGMGPDNVKKAITQLSGEFLGGFSVHFRTLKDFVAHYSKEERLPRERRVSPLIAPFLSNIPFASQKLPVAESLTRAEPREQELPLKEQLTGLRFTTKNIIEKEIDRLGIKQREIQPRTGIPEADNEIKKIAGDFIEKNISKLINNEKYLRLSDPIKREVIKDELGKIRLEATRFVFRSNPKLFKKRLESKIPQELKEMISNREFENLSKLPKKRKKQLELAGDLR